MKIRISVIWFLLGASFPAFSQDRVAGVWVLDIENTIKIMTAEERIKFDSLPPPVKTRAREAMRDREFHFNKDGSVVVNWRARNENRKSSGTWTLDATRRILTLWIEGQTFEYSFEIPSASVLILKSHEGGGYFNTLYFEKTPPAKN
jgi:hypothetical protein